MEPPVQRYKLTVAYRGTAYHGWQHQTAASTWKGPMPREGHGIPTVQQTLKQSLERVMRHPVTVVGASRTDSGVHAKGQVAHFDSIRLGMPTEGMRRALNHDLPDDVIVRAIEAVPREFDAIRSTASKRYQYLIWNHVDRPVFFGDLAWHRWQPLDVAAMQAAAADFVGTHDFSSFARPGHKRETTIRTVTHCTVSARNPRIVIGVEGTGFLWHMVRIMAGTLVEIGLGLRGAHDVPQMLAALDRRAAGQTAPPHGLYLQWIKTEP
jgi:tRNA pseudouridine38-40 synthase